MKSFRIGVPLAAVVCAGALSAACGDRGFVEPPRPAWLRDYQPVEEVYRSWSSGVTEPRRRLVRDRESWERIVAADESGPRPVPAVDFRDSMLIVVARGAEALDVVGSAFEGFRLENDTLYVALRVRRNGPDCLIDWMEMAPMMAARLPKHDGPVVVREWRIDHRC